MKNLSIAFVFVLMCNCTIAQDSIHTTFSSTQTPAGKHANELGLDLTPLIKNYINFSNTSTYYQPNYMVSYRRYFNKSNFRAAIGGNFLNSESPSPYNGDSLNTRYFNKQQSFVLRAGYEWFQNLSPRWQAFYGADLVVGYSKQRNDAPYWNGGYANGQENTAKSLGIGPVLGIRYRLNSHVSLITESSLLFQYSETSSFRYYLPITKAYPALPNGPKATNKTTATLFSYPLSIILTVNI